MKLSIRGHRQFDLPWQILSFRFSTVFLSELLIYEGCDNYYNNHV